MRHLHLYLMYHWHHAVPVGSVADILTEAFGKGKRTLRNGCFVGYHNESIQTSVKASSSVLKWQQAEIQPWLAAYPLHHRFNTSKASEAHVICTEDVLTSCQKG